MRRRRSPFKEQRDDENDGEQRRRGFKGNRELTVLTAPPRVRQWLSSDNFIGIRSSDCRLKAGFLSALRATSCQH